MDRAWQALHDAIAANEPLFEKPRTRFRDGVRFGLRKGADKLSGDLDAAIERIERLMREERARVRLALEGHADRRHRLVAQRCVSRSCSLRSRAARATASLNDPLTRR